MELILSIYSPCRENYLLRNREMGEQGGGRVFNEIIGLLLMNWHAGVPKEFYHLIRTISDTISRSRGVEIKSFSIPILHSVEQYILNSLGTQFEPSITGRPGQPIWECTMCRFQDFLPARFYVKSILVILNLKNLPFWPYCSNDSFWHSEISQNWFHVKSEWQENG